MKLERFAVRIWKLHLCINEDRKSLAQCVCNADKEMNDASCPQLQSGEQGLDMGDVSCLEVVDSFLPNSQDTILITLGSGLIFGCCAGHSLCWFLIEASMFRFQSRFSLNAKKLDLSQLFFLQVCENEESFTGSMTSTSSLIREKVDGWALDVPINVMEDGVHRCDTYISSYYALNAMQISKEPPWSFKASSECLDGCQLFACFLLYKLYALKHMLSTMSRSTWDPGKHMYKLTSSKFAHSLNDTSNFEAKREGLLFQFCNNEVHNGVIQLGSKDKDAWKPYLEWLIAWQCKGFRS